MTRYAPQSQTQALMRQKREIAQRLLAHGLTVTQVSQQLRCSRYFVQQVRDARTGLEAVNVLLPSEAC